MKKLPFILTIILGIVLFFSTISINTSTSEITIASLINQSHAGDEEAYVYTPRWQDFLCVDIWGNGHSTAIVTDCDSGSERCVITNCSMYY